MARLLRFGRQDQLRQRWLHRFLYFYIPFPAFILQCNVFDSDHVRVGVEIGQVKLIISDESQLVFAFGLRF